MHLVAVCAFVVVLAFILPTYQSICFDVFVCRFARSLSVVLIAALSFMITF